VSADPSVPQMTIRRFATSDLATVQGLVAEMQDFERQVDPRLRPGNAIASDYTAAMLARCETEDGAILLADVESATIGFIAVVSAAPNDGLDQPPGTHALVTDLSVTPSFRRRGVGRELLKAAEQFARSRGAAELRIAVLDGNRAAHDLYESAGFVRYITVLAKGLGQ
jgi:ribosomal protein S18 acetylase RimI-like enzyme